MAHARGLLCLVFLGFALACPFAATFGGPLCQARDQCSGIAVVEVSPEWQTDHPNCMVVATGRNLGEFPEVSIIGEGCDSPESITVARIVVTYPDCFGGEIYLVELGGGVVEVDLIDLF
jgi:hypothetical protein